MKWAQTTLMVSKTKLPKGSMGDDYQSQFKFHDYYSKKYDIIDSIPFHPYGTVKDLVGVAGFLFLFAMCCSSIQRWVDTSLSRLTLKLQTH